MNNTDWNSFDLNLEQKNIPGSLSNTLDNQVGDTGLWNSIPNNSYQSQFTNTVPPQTDTIGNRLSGMRPNPQYQPISPERMGIPSGYGGYTPRMYQHTSISGLPTTSDNVPSRAQQVTEREQQREQIANQYYLQQPNTQVNNQQSQIHGMDSSAGPGFMLQNQFHKQLSAPNSEYTQQPQYQPMQQQYPGHGFTQQQSPPMQQYQSQPPTQGIQTTRTLGGIDGRDAQNDAIAANRFSQTTMIPRGGPGDCHNPVNMEHVYQRSLFLDGTPAPQDLRQHVSPQQWQHHQAMMNQYRTKNSYRDQANDRLSELTPISRSLAPPLATPNTTAIPGMGLIPSASAHGAVPQSSHPIAPTGPESGGYRSFYKSKRRDDLNTRINNLGFNPGQMPTPREDSQGPEMLDRLRPEVTNF